jgi:hypothetical protein
MKGFRPWLLLASFAGLAVAGGGHRVRAQVEDRRCTSFAQLEADPGAPLRYTIPLAYGSFADVEIGGTGSGTLQLEVEAWEQSVLKDRRIWVLVPGRVVLLSEILDVENLFQIGDPLLIRLEASAPVSAMLVRRD